MLPYKDENPTELVPIVTVLLIVADVAVWLFVQGAGLSYPALQEAVCAYGAIPAELMGRGPVDPRICPVGISPTAGWLSLFTSMFLHGGWGHLIGNMVFLWVFGNNVEDSMGHLRFVAFYLLTGLAAGLAHVLLNASSAVPTVGASGAISGVMGGYVLLYPRAVVHVLMPYFLVVRMPAYVVLGYWIVLQVLLGLAEGPGTGGGVAFWAHVGGFVAGFALIKVFARAELVGAKRTKRHLSRAEIRQHGWWW
jgi:membrane associated rhomboid family serine protease